MADQPAQMTPDEFASKVKAKYPAYKDMDNNTLVKKMLTKYPQYKSQIVTGKDAILAAGRAKIAANPAPKGFDLFRDDTMFDMMDTAGRELPSFIGGVAKSMAGGPVLQAYEAYQKTKGEMEQYKKTGQSTEEVEAAKRRGAGYDPFYSNVSAPIAENIGMNVKGAEQGAKEGRPGKVLGTAAAPLVGMAAMDVAGRALPTAVKKTGEAARKYAEDVVTKSTTTTGQPGLIKDRETGIDLPARIAEQTRMKDVGGLEKQVERTEKQSLAHTKEVQRIAGEATQRGLRVNNADSARIYKSLDALNRNTSLVKQMQDLSAANPQFRALQSSLWDPKTRPPEITPDEMLNLRRDLDDIARGLGGESAKDTPVARAAQNLRTELDQRADKAFPGWKDANERASALMKANEAWGNRLDNARRGILSEATHRLLADKSVTGVRGILGAGGAVALYEAFHGLGAKGLAAYVATTGALSIARGFYESIPSQTFRIAFADGLADALIGPRKGKGPGAWPTPPPPNVPALPPGTPGGAAGGGPQGTGGGAPQGMPPQQAIQITVQAAQQAAAKAGIPAKQINGTIQQMVGQLQLPPASGTQGQP